MSSLQAIIFDLEGTIIDTETIWDEAAVEFLKRHDRVYDRARTKHLLMGGSIAAGAKLMQDQYQFEGDPQALATQRRDIFEELLKRNIRFIDGFKTFFAQVKPSYKLAIATSMERRFLADVDEQLGLVSMFDHHVYSIEDIGFIPKPQPNIFLHAARHLGVDPSCCLVIEDAPKGIQAANAAGMRSVGITTSVPRNLLVEADQIVDKFSEISL